MEPPQIIIICISNGPIDYYRSQYFELFFIVEIYIPNEISNSQFWPDLVFDICIFYTNSVDSLQNMIDTRYFIFQ